MNSAENVNNAYDSRHTIASILAPVDIPPDQIGHVRSSQLESVDKLGVLIVLTNLLNAAIVLVMFSPADTTGVLGIWGSVMCLGCALLFMRTMEAGGRRSKPMRSRHDTLKYFGVSVTFGVVWSMLPLIILPGADAFSQMAIGVILSGLIFGGGLVLARLPEAAFGFILPVIASMVVSFALFSPFRGDFLALLCVVYMIIVAVCIRWTYNQFVAQHLNKAAVGQQNALIGLLLRDFEESTSDWLWQTNARGLLLDIPMTIKGAKTGYNLMRNGVEMLSLFEPSEARNVLSMSLIRQQGFRDLALEVSDESEGSRWWSLTGKPLIENGVFIGFRGVASDVTTSKQIEDRIAYMAHYDGLTGLPNRATFQEKLERIWSSSRADSGAMAVCLMDLDNFKWVNDTLGHAAGDEVLRKLGERLGECVQSGETVARLGGDEFALILHRESEKELLEALDTLVSVLCAPYDVWGSTANCGASLGVRPFSRNQLDPHTLMTHADLALYQAKRKGKGNWCLFTDDLDARARARRLIEADLHTALRNEELSLNFQPIVSAQTGKVVACETLLRWQHPERGEIMPSEFIEHAEDCGLIARMGDWVIREALSQARAMPDDVRLSVNISPLQLHSANLISTIVNALASNQISPGRLDLEITESVLLSDTDFVLERLLQLRKLGLSLSLDDFGTGFSSLSYLRQFPFDKIKIDKCFVSDLETNEDSRAITRATISLAKSLGLRCTAEGVETSAQRDFLVGEGCDELQGYFISRAKPLVDLSELMDLGALTSSTGGAVLTKIDQAPGATGKQHSVARKA